MTTPTIKATGKAFDPQTRDWTQVVTYEARNRQEALNWIKFNRDWMKDLKVIEEHETFARKPSLEHQTRALVEAFRSAARKEEQDYLVGADLRAIEGGDHSLAAQRLWEIARQLFEIAEECEQEVW